MFRLKVSWNSGAMIAAAMSFDDCAKLSAKDFVATAKSNSLVPSIAHGMAVSSAAQGAIQDVVSQYWNTDNMTAQQAMDRLADAAKTK